MKKVSNVAVLAKREHKDAARVVRHLSEWLTDRKVRFSLEAGAAALIGKEGIPERQLVHRDTDALLVLGGDGTFLWGARLVSDTGVPVLGVNLGSLGYLTEVPLDGATQAMEQLIAGDYKIAHRMRLEATLLRDGRTLLSESALNDAVITKSAIARMIEMSTEVDGKPVTVFRADGLIVSTPTGSTAYSLAAGGPIVSPTLDCLVLTPICPHTLTNRPLVLPATSRVRIVLNAKDPSDTQLTLDGQVGCPLVSQDVLEVHRASQDLNVIKLNHAAPDPFEILRTKLKWGGR
ncbi:MAG: NAD(+)/NADH kinase [Nitrospirae bacterium]|nr:NAD(+)/NADH kinase [Nitrospirota bacterium]